MKAKKTLIAILLTTTTIFAISGCGKTNTPTLPPEYSNMIESLYSNVSIPEIETSENEISEIEEPETMMSDVDTPIEKFFEVSLIIECEENLAFSRYDIDIFLDDEKIGNLDHGTTKTFQIELNHGNHQLTFTKENEKDIDGTCNIEVTQDLEFNCKIHCKNDQIKIKESSLTPQKSEGNTPPQSPEYTIDYSDAASFEKALNDGIKVNGKIVKFIVNDYKPDSVLGINCWAGEHLNFISNEELDIEKGAIITGKITEEPTKVLNSWKIIYEVLYINESKFENNTSTDHTEESSDIEPAKITLTMSEEDFKGLNYKEAESIFRDMGFTSFKYRTVDTENESDADTICYIEITEWFLGNSDFSKGDKFDKSSTITLFCYKYTEPEKPSPVFYSTNDYETAKKGNSGVFSYKNKSGSYDIYWIIDFDEGYVYWFTEGNGESTCDKVKITSGNLNNTTTITWHDSGDEWSWHLHFKYVNHPETLVVNDHYGIATEFRTTDLDKALELRDTKIIKEY